MTILKSVGIALGQVKPIIQKRLTPGSTSIGDIGERLTPAAPVRRGAFGNHVLVQLFLYCEKCGAPLDCVFKGRGRVEVNCEHICEPTQLWKHKERLGSRG